MNFVKKKKRKKKRRKLKGPFQRDFSGFISDLFQCYIFLRQVKILLVLDRGQCMTFKLKSRYNMISEKDYEDKR